MTKSRVLFASEYSQLNTGYAVYIREILKQMAATGKYELAEHAAYCGRENYVKLPWKVYPNIPDNEQEGEVYKRDPANQFGKWRFDRVCLDFKPDFVLACRDPWMDQHVYQSHYRDFFHLIGLAPVDSAPQRSYWFEDFASADAMLTFTKWGRQVLDEEGGGLVNTVGDAPICVDPVFAPVKDKRAHKEKMGLNTNSLIIGTVMRNQKRKLYPDLFQAFAELRKCVNKTIADNLYLLIFTRYPDMGWEIPNLITNFGLSDKVVAAYICEECKYYFIDFFRDAKTLCPKCKKYSCSMPGVKLGLDNESLAKVYNCMDLYVQWANAEGFGGPLVEAAGCGLPIVGMDYASISEVGRNLGAYLIPPGGLAKEMETGAYRAYSNTEGLTKELKRLVEQPRELLEKRGHKSRENLEKYYSSWEKTAKVWMDYIDGAQLSGLQGKWNSPPRIVEPVQSIPKFKNNHEFVTWSILNILGRPELLYSKKHIEWVCALNVEGEMVPVPGEMGGSKLLEVRPEHLMKLFQKMAADRNRLEQVRTGMVNMGTPTFIRVANA